MRAKALGEVCALAVEALALLVDEDRCVVGELGIGGAGPVREPGLERCGDVGSDRERARIVRLVVVEVGGAELEVDVADIEAAGLARARTDAREEAVEDPPAERHARRSHEGRLLARIQPPHGLLGAQHREEALGQRVGGAEAHREHGEPEEAVEHLRDVAPRCGRTLERDRAHDGFGVVERELGDRDVSRERVDVRLEALLVLVGALLLADVIGVRARELARRPGFAELADRRRRAPLPASGSGAGRQLAADDLIDQGDDVGELLAVALRSALEDGAHALGVPRLPELRAEVGEELGALACAGGVLGGDGGQLEGWSIALRDVDAGEPEEAFAERGAGGDRGHGVPQSDGGVVEAGAAVDASPSQASASMPCGAPIFAMRAATRG